MKNEQLVDELYERVIDTFLENVIYERELLASAYKDYLVRVYGDIDIVQEEYSKAFETFSASQKEKWKNVSGKDKKKELVLDEFLVIIGEISEKGFEAAKIKKWQNIAFDREEGVLAINKLKENLDKVQNYNKELAKNLVSEGILDYNYATGASEVMSLRVGRSGNIPKH